MKRYKAVVGNLGLQYIDIDESGDYVRYAEVAALLARVEQVENEMTEALCNGAFFNPEMFGSMLKGSDNPILRWRDALTSLRQEAGR